MLFVLSTIPVVYAPNFGYDTKGGSTMQSSNNLFAWGFTYSPVSNGTLKSLTIYVRYSNAGSVLALGIYDASDNSKVAETGNWTVTLGYDGWKTLNTTTTPMVYSNKQYYLAWVTYTATSDIYMDTPNGGRIIRTSCPSPLPDPAGWTHNQTATHQKYSIYANYTLAMDTTPPTYSAFSNNETVAKYPCNMSITLNDETALSHYIFGWNGSGVWVNDSAVNMGGVATYNAYIVKDLPRPAGTIVNSRYWFNDTANNWNSSNLLSITTTTIGGAALDAKIDLLIVMAIIIGILTYIGVKR